MRIKKNDNVIMLQGKDRGKRGKILVVLPRGPLAGGRVVVEGLNMIKKHQKAKKQGQKGQIIHKERAVDISNVQIICTKCSKPARIGYQVNGENKVRICKKCKSEI
jgi:large subunit ribosomal protein L24